jgi:hypothetical protein
MTIISTMPDTATLTMTIVADLAAPPKRAWQVWVDPNTFNLRLHGCSLGGWAGRDRRC